MGEEARPDWDSAVTASSPSTPARSILHTDDHSEAATVCRCRRPRVVESRHRRRKVLRSEFRVCCPLGELCRYRVVWHGISEHRHGCHGTNLGCMRGCVFPLSSLCSPVVWSWWWYPVVWSWWWYPVVWSWWWYPAGDKQSAAQAHARRALSTFQYHRQVERDWCDTNCRYGECQQGTKEEGPSLTKVPGRPLVGQKKSSRRSVRPLRVVNRTYFLTRCCADRCVSPKFRTSLRH